MELALYKMHGSKNTFYVMDIESLETIPFIELTKWLCQQDKNSGADVLLIVLPSEKAKKMTDSMNKFLETTSTELRFKFHEELNTYYVTLIDANTEEIVREIPSKKLMDMYAAMRDFVGFFVEEKI